MPTPTPVPISDLMTDVGTVVTSATGWMSNFANTITSNSLLVLTCIAVPLCGLGVGLLSRLMRRKA